MLVRFSTRLQDDANRAVLAFGAALDADPPSGVVEVSTSLASVYVRFDPALTRRSPLIDALTRMATGADWAHLRPTGPRRSWIIPTAFGGALGPQLEETAALVGITPDQAIAEIAAAPVRVLAIGFAPGQPYLGMLPPHWNVPRQQSLTPNVPVGALVAAVQQLVLFSASTPTGWRHIGQTAFRAFRPDQTDPFPLRPGDMLRFTPVSAEEYGRILAADTDGSGGARLEIAP